VSTIDQWWQRVQLSLHMRTDNLTAVCSAAAGSVPVGKDRCSSTFEGQPRARATLIPVPPSSTAPHSGSADAADALIAAVRTLGSESDGAVNENERSETCLYSAIESQQSTPAPAAGADFERKSKHTLAPSSRKFHRLEWHPWLKVQ
jgi:hypothetical protein